MGHLRRVEIRPATPDDVPALGEMMRASMAGLGAGFYAADRVEAAARFLTVPDDALIEDGTLYVARLSTPHPLLSQAKGGAPDLSPRPPLQDEPLGEGEFRLVGVGGWSGRRKLFTGSAEQEGLTGRLDPATEPARIRAFFVRPDFARRGIARGLYERCEADARAAGFRTFALMATLPGAPLYRALGFGEERPTTIRLPDGSGLECVEMKKSLR